MEKNVHSQTNGKWQLVRCFVMVVLGKRLRVAWRVIKDQGANDVGGT